MCGYSSGFSYAATVASHDNWFSVASVRLTPKVVNHVINNAHDYLRRASQYGAIDF